MACLKEVGFICLERSESVNGLKGFLWVSVGCGASRGLEQVQGPVSSHKTFTAEVGREAGSMLREQQGIMEAAGCLEDQKTSV